MFVHWFCQLLTVIGIKFLLLQEGDFVAISSNSYSPWVSHKGIAVKRSWNTLNRGPFQVRA